MQASISTTQMGHGFRPAEDRTVRGWLKSHSQGLVPLFNFKQWDKFGIPDVFVFCGVSFVWWSRAEWLNYCQGRDTYASTEALEASFPRLCPLTQCCKKFWRHWGCLFYWKEKHSTTLSVKKAHWQKISHGMQSRFASNVFQIKFKQCEKFNIPE